jgi:single-strand DNA-binding protein
MNKFIATGRLVTDPEIRYTKGSQPMAVASYRLAIDRKFKREGDQQTADFINCIAFAKAAEFAEKYLHKGMKIAIVAHVQTGSYKGNDGKMVYTTDFVIEEQEFCESKTTGETKPQYSQTKPAPSNAVADGWVNVHDSIEDEGLPFN